MRGIFGFKQLRKMEAGEIAYYSYNGDWKMPQQRVYHNIQRFKRLHQPNWIFTTRIMFTKNKIEICREK